MEGRHCFWTSNKHGREVDWNGWWQYLNANENEVGLDEMVHVLSSGVVIWKCNLLSWVPTARGSRKRDQGTVPQTVATLLSGQNLCWSTSSTTDVENGVFYTFALLCKKTQGYSLLSIVSNLSFIITRFHWNHKLCCPSRHSFHSHSCVALEEAIKTVHNRHLSLWWRK